MSLRRSSRATRPRGTPPTRSPRVRASRIAFAGRTFEDVEVHIIPDSGLPGFPTGLLGLGLLDEERVLLDLGGGSLRLMQSA